MRSFPSDPFARRFGTHINRLIPTRNFIIGLQNLPIRLTHLPKKHGRLIYSAAAKFHRTHSGKNINKHQSICFNKYLECLHGTWYFLLCLKITCRLCISRAAHFGIFFPLCTHTTNLNVLHPSSANYSTLISSLKTSTLLY